MEFAVESAAARVCREAEGRVATNIFVRNMDLGVPKTADSQRLEVVVDGLPLFGGVQLAVDTIWVSALKGDGEPRRRAADRDGVAFAKARRIKERTCPELVGPGSRARLVVLALEVGGRWSKKANIFPRQVGTATHAAPSRASVEVAVVRDHFLRNVPVGWRGGHGSDGLAPPSHEVERDQAVALSE